MIRPMSYRLFRAMNSDAFEPVELFELRFLGQDPAGTYRFTSAQQEITWQGGTYLPISMTRSKIEEKVASTSTEVDAISMTLSNVDRQLAGQLQTLPLEGATATLYLSDRNLLGGGNARPMDAVMLTTGEARDVSLSDDVLSFRILNVLGQQNQITVPRRVYQARCNYRFGSRACGVDLAGNDANDDPITMSCECGAGSTASVLRNVTGITADADLLEGATAVMDGGVNGLQERPVQRVVGSEVRLRVSLPQAPAVGDDFYLRRQCRKDRADCALFRGNALAFGGFPSVPPVRFKPSEVRIDD